MDPKIQKKLEEYKKLVTHQANKNPSASSSPGRPDSLRQVIRSKKDADDFMADLESAIKRSK